MKNLRDQFVADAHRIAERRLLRCSSGNLSMRLDKERMLVTASRSWLETLTPEQVSVCRIADGSLIEGKKPTVELAFHAGILRARPEMNVVLHFQTPCATTLACRESEDINYFVIPEIPFYLGPIGHVPFLPPGSPELAQAVVDAMKDHNLAQLSHHGQVTDADSIDHAIQNAEFFELACEIIVRGGDTVVPLPPDAVETIMAMRSV